MPSREVDADPVACATRRREIRSAIKSLKARCLIQAATWAAELLPGLPSVPPGASGAVQSSSFQEASATAADCGRSTLAHEGQEEDESESESDAVILGRLYLEGKEYRRAAHVLREEPGRVAFFLCNYALLLAGEKRKEEETFELANLQPAKARQPANGELPQLMQVLEARDAEGKLDPFGLFLYGVTLHKWGQKSSAIDLLCRSVNLFPCNWSAWTELQALCSDTATFNSTLEKLKPHWARTFWEASTLVELHKNDEGLQRCDRLARDFPGSIQVAVQAATAHCNKRDFDASEQMFEGVLKADPYRVEGMDTLSNILYVKEKFAALSHLAHQLVLVDKYRPETCCVIGNYLSLKGRHERAVVYFRRALRLNRNYLAAWTLMGHEYVEMKNTPAAIEAYRNAVDINPRDYRAWYGLGQTYEILALPYYALYYYRKATQLRPSDARMWCALGQCYESEHMHMGAAPGAWAGGGTGEAALQEQMLKALRCYERAYQCNDSEGIALQKLAKLHEALGRTDTAALYHRRNLERLDAEQAGGPEVVEALLFLGSYNRHRGDLDQAEHYCSRLLDFSGPGKEEAKALLREIRSMQQHSQQARHSLLGTPLGQGIRGLSEEDLGAHEEDDLEGLEDEAMELGDTP